MATISRLCELIEVLILIVIVLSDVVMNITFHRDCSHRPPKDDQILNHIHIDPPHILRKRSVKQNLRIHLSYDKSMYKLPKDKFTLIHSVVLPEAVRYWEETLRVTPLKNPIKLSRKCKTNEVFYSNGENEAYCRRECDSVTMCGEVIVPEKHLEVCKVCNSRGENCGLILPLVDSEGIPNADFVFYVSAMETERCNKNQTVAYAAHCQQEATFDRPIAGHANLCPGSISTKAQDLDTVISTVKHELLHALGFSVSLYAFYRDKDGRPLTKREHDGKPYLNQRHQTRQWSEQTIKTVIRKKWKVHKQFIEKPVHLVVTPRVVEEVRKHFNCPHLEGAELEDQGEDGTILTHWEKRLFENEAMTGTHTQNPVYSRITLALMEDTGWYLPNYDKAQELEWGKNLGCRFAMRSCKDWIDFKRSRGEHVHPFCDKVKSKRLETECTENRKSVALCNLMEYADPLPSIYQNFDYIPKVGNDVSKYGGSVALADFCPYIQEFTWRSKDLGIRGSHCGYNENNPRDEHNFALEYYGSGSMCFDHTNMAWEDQNCHQTKEWHHWGSGCYMYECSQGRLHIIVKNYTYTCFKPGQILKIRIFSNNWLHIGALVCPRCEEICPISSCAVERINDIEISALTNYPQDELQCSSSQAGLSFRLFYLSIIMIILSSLTGDNS